MSLTQEQIDQNKEKNLNNSIRVFELDRQWGEIDSIKRTSKLVREHFLITYKIKISCPVEKLLGTANKAPGPIQRAQDALQDLKEKANSASSLSDQIQYLADLGKKAGLYDAVDYLNERGGP